MPDRRKRGGRVISSFTFRRNLQEFSNMGRQLEQEREGAAKNVERILRETPLDQWITLIEHPDLLTCGALQRLGMIVDAELTREPKYAEGVAALAVSLAEALPSTYPAMIAAQTRATAWKDFAKTLSFLGRQEEALSAFATAASYVENVPSAEHDLAIIRLNLSITYQEMGRYSDALTLLSECKELFRDHGDDRLFIVSSFYEGLVLQRLHRYREARETHLLLLASESDIDTETLAALHHAIGYCSIELGDYDSAEGNLLKGIRLCKELGHSLDATKGELGRGRLLIRRGLYRQGINHLRPVRHQLLKHSLAEEAGLCGLDMVEAMLRLGKSREAEALAKTIINEFLAASLSARAITALGYLTEAIVSRKASPTMATHVRDYVLSLRTAPEREFTLAELYAD